MYRKRQIKCAYKPRLLLSIIEYQMIADCENGLVDMILTKSLSRFARNTVDSLTTIRKLKVLGIGIYFEKENTFTLDSKGDVFHRCLIQSDYLNTA